MLGTVVVFIIPSQKLADKIGKGSAYGLGLALASVAMIISFFLPQGPTPLMYLIAVLAGAGFAGQFVFPGCMVPDVVELDEKMTGERREGLYFGIWAMVGKITGALAIAMGGWALSWFGYVEGAVQTVTSLLGIRLFYALIPTVGLLVSVPLLLKYPITKKSHAELVCELDVNNRL